MRCDARTFLAFLECKRTLREQQFFFARHSSTAFWPDDTPDIAHLRPENRMQMRVAVTGIRIGR